MRNKLLKTLSTATFLVAALTVSLFAQDAERITIKDLNTYPEPLEVASDISEHPLDDSTVTFTAVIQSYPRSSGIRSYNSGDNSIGSVHVFVIDTTANSMGRDGMSMQVVDFSVGLMETFNRGDVVDITGALSFFNNTAQFGPESATLVGNVNEEGGGFEHLAGLLDPWEVSLDELNIANEDGTFEINLANYPKYSNAYVRIVDASISNVSRTAAVGGRVDYALNADGSRIYGYDTSLRFRNDRSAYRTLDGIPDYNWRRAVDGEFNPPVGAIADVNGFLLVNGDDPDNVRPDANSDELFGINPFEDGVFWGKDVNGDPLRFVNGEGSFVWPNDFVVTGLPPQVTAFSTDPAGPIVPSATPINIAMTAEGPEAGISVDSVRAFFTAGEIDTTFLLTKSGDDFTGTLPELEELTSASLYFELYGSDGKNGRYPNTGAEGLFVLDQEVTAIEFIQKTADGMSGDSPLAGSGAIPVNFTATVVASSLQDGFVSIQDKAAKWSGIFVDPDSDTEQLSRGDMLQVNEIEVSETFGVTSVTLSDFEVLETTNDMLDTLAVALLTQDVTATAAGSEEYEGMLLTFADVKVTTNQADGSRDFGEWEFGSRQGGEASVDTLEAGDGLRVDDGTSFGSLTYGETLNDFVKTGAVIESLTGVLNFSFGNPKMNLRSVEEVVSDDWTIPDPVFGLTAPADEAEVVVSDDITVTWTATEDIDGNDLTYEWVLYTADTVEVVAVTSNNEGADTEVLLDFATVDGLLESAGLAVGESADFVWNVRVSDGNDTLDVSSGFDEDLLSFPATYYSLNLERGMTVNNEEVSGLPEKYDLKQNYPNPFNPSTSISFDLPATSNVILNVYDMLGRKVATLVDKSMNAGTHNVQFDASQLSSGMYIYRIEAGAFTSIRKMMLIK